MLEFIYLPDNVMYLLFSINKSGLILNRWFYDSYDTYFTWLCPTLNILHLDFSFFQVLNS